MYFKKRWFFGKDIITTEVDKMINEIIQILRKNELKENNDRLKDEFKEEENISYYIEENNVNSNKIYNDILELTKE